MQKENNGLVVIDASVAVKWILHEHGSYEATELVARNTLIAPDILWIECASALNSQVRRRNITASQARFAFADLLCVPVDTVPAGHLLDDAFSLMLDLDHAIYDCLYLALSMQRRIPLLTADKRLVAAAARHPSLNGLAALFPSGMR